jgi:hypothetical protein
LRLPVCVVLDQRAARVWHAKPIPGESVVTHACGAWVCVFGICAVEAGPSGALAGASVWPVNSRLFPSNAKKSPSCGHRVYACRIGWRHVHQQGRHPRVGTAPAVCKRSEVWGWCFAQAVGTGFMPCMCVCGILTVVYYPLLSGVLWQQRVLWLSRPGRSLLLSRCTEPLHRAAAQSRCTEPLRQPRASR